MHKGLRFSEKLIYIVGCICTLGALWMQKVVIKAAILEAKDV